jgi:DNA gyrase/topoisomerase IV subunit B
MVLYPSFIREHELYLMSTPLFSAVHNDLRAYGNTQHEAKKNFKAKHGSKHTPDIRYNKGLGEMSPVELVDVLDPKTRLVSRLTIGDLSANAMESLMGESVEMRYNILKDLNK